MSNRISTFTILFGNIVLLTGLALLAYLGFYNRYWADDWCYSADARNLGTVNATLQYFNPEGIGYSNNRYALTFFSALTENTLGMFGNQIFATLTIVFWFFGITWTLYNLSKLIKPIPFGILLFVSGFLLYYNLYISPQRFQILYWRSGVLPYSTALIFWMIMLGFITSQMNQAKPIRWYNFIIPPIAFLAAGLGEISSTLLFSGTSILFLATWYAKNKKQAWAEKSFPTTFIVWLFLLIGIVTLIISPSNIRIEEMSVKQSPLSAVPALSIRHAVDFIFISLKTLPIPHVIFIGTMFCLAILFGRENPASFLTGKQVLFLLALTTLITFLLITVIQAPTAYFYSATPDPRGKSLARFVMLISLAFISWMLGIWSAQKIKLQFLTIASVLFLLVSSAYTTRSFINTYKEEFPYFVYRAELWDERDALIISEKEQGNTLIEVPAIDTAQIDVRDIFVTRSKGWTEFVQNCASRYYGVDGLKVED
ncbi:MAG TPA: hypothetical protein DHW49_14805 [Anaerolineae bacterium]|nr:hypothetical protein [Anaerolineae bacterium]